VFLRTLDDLTKAVCTYHLQVLGLHVFDDLGEQRGDILADSHVGNHSLDSILASLAVLAVELDQQLGILACLSERIVDRGSDGLVRPKSEDRVREGQGIPRWMSPWLKNWRLSQQTSIIGMGHTLGAGGKELWFGEHVHVKVWECLAAAVASVGGGREG